MLDLHATTVTPGAVLVLGAIGTIAAGGDGQSVAGVPIKPSAVLVGWGFLSPSADTIARIRMQSQDQVDPINGYDIAPGATNIKVADWVWDNLPYRTGQRVLTAGTNTGVVAGTGLTLDAYPDGQSIVGSRRMPGMVSPGTATTFGAALVANTWGNQPFAPVTALPNGKYAILGVRCSALTNVAAVRFSHADFGAYMPGFPVVNEQLTAILGIQLAPKTDLFDETGYQFVNVSEMLGIPSCPVFTVSNAGTGLTIWAIAAQACTPVITVILAKVG